MVDPNVAKRDLFNNKTKMGIQRQNERNTFANVKKIHDKEVRKIVGLKTHNKAD